MKVSNRPEALQTAGNDCFGNIQCQPGRISANSGIAVKGFILVSGIMTHAERNLDPFIRAIGHQSTQRVEGIGINGQRHMAIRFSGAFGTAPLGEIIRCRFAAAAKYQGVQNFVSQPKRGWITFQRLAVVLCVREIGVFTDKLKYQRFVRKLNIL